MSRIKRKKEIISFLWMFITIVLCLQWIILKLLNVNLDFPFDFVLPGVAIFGAAFIISWAAELAQLEISQTLAIAFLALITVLPEYTVDIYFAWMAGKKPEYTAFATANMTGANRLLIGLGWSAVVFVYWFKSKNKEIKIGENHRVEIFALILATIYSFIIPLKGTLSLVDSIVLIGIFVLYIVNATKSEISEPELEGPVEILAGYHRSLRIFITFLFFLYSGYTIFISAGPFAEGLLHAGRKLGIEEFILVQWLAPLASEAPEFIIAMIFALKGQPVTALSVVISSKINQWTLLIGMLPLAFSISSQHLLPMNLDARQIEEILLTSAQSLFALIILSNLRFSLKEALFLFLLFITQLFFTSPQIRYIYCGVYILFAFGMLIFISSNRNGFKQMFKKSWFVKK
jgi:cation:H+ antiporter